MAGLSEGQEHERTGYNSSTIKCKEQGLIDTGACLTHFSTLIHFSTPEYRNGATHSGLGLPISINGIRIIPPTDMPVNQPNLDNPDLTLSSQVILDCVK